ncbi:SDR family oxidoreductase, partial [Streptomyces sp. SID10244]|nr:SDR family oxidoreductase [Streptomyces sp. SID10244]
VDIDSDRAEQTAKLVEQQGGDAIAITADVAQKAQISAAVKETVEHYGKLDIAWANAGVVSRGGVPTVAGGESVLFED